MSLQQSIRSAASVAACIAMVAMPAHAQQRVLLDWSGRVDSVARISIQGGGARVSLVGTQNNGAGNLHVRNELPHRDGTVTSSRPARRRRHRPAAAADNDIPRSRIREDSNGLILSTAL
jgi:hypothetical protein